MDQPKTCKQMKDMNFLSFHLIVQIIIVFTGCRRKDVWLHSALEEISLDQIPLEKGNVEDPDALLELKIKYLLLWELLRQNLCIKTN